jgi:hypothetical protein
VDIFDSVLLFCEEGKMLEHQCKGIDGSVALLGFCPSHADASATFDPPPHSGTTIQLQGWHGSLWQLLQDSTQLWQVGKFKY